MRRTKVVAGVAALLLATALLLRWSPPLDALRVVQERTPGELIRYTQRRLQGHDKLEALLLPVIRLIQRHIERPVPAGELPSLGKGQQGASLAPIIYDMNGLPLASSLRHQALLMDAGPDVLVHSAAQLALAVADATAGRTIEIAAGEYLIEHRIETRHPGTAQQPIVVRATTPGLVVLRVATNEGIVVNQPYWVFENLTLRGVCKQHDDCEHAFHVVRAARATVLRNNRIEDFNAHVKVNGEDGHFPDAGLLQFNTLTNSAPRHTDKPTSPVDIVAASRWRVADNVVEDFTKLDGNGVSYGIFMKGAGQGGRIERNLVVCSTGDLSGPGLRVGISLGGGGSAPDFCRDRRCDAEHSGGLIANNVVAHCNDFGIDVFRSDDTVVTHNTLINTAGIDVRRAPSIASVIGNVLDGRIRQRDGGQAALQSNLVATLPEWMAAPDRLDLRWLAMPDPVGLPDRVDDDFCADHPSRVRLPGALGARPSCAR